MIVLGILALVSICAVICCGSLWVPTQSLLAKWTMGCASIVLYLLAISWFAALRWVHIFPIVFLSLAGATFWHRREPLHAFVASRLRALPRYSILFGIVLTACVMLASSFPISWYDSLLYHIPFAKLLTYQHTIPGMALVDLRLGMISSTFLFAALGSAVSLYEPLLGLPNVVYHVIVVALIVRGLSNLVGRMHVSAALFQVISGSLLFVINGTSLVPSLAQEVGLAVWIICAVTLLLEKNIAVACIALTLAYTTKSSAVLIVAPLGVFLLLQLQSQRKVRSGFFFLAVAIGIMTMLHSIRLSGYALFPVVATHMPLYAGSDVVPADVSKLAATVYEWARFNPNLPRETREMHWCSSTFFPSLPPIVWIGVLAGLLSFLKIRRVWQILRTETIVFLSSILALLVAYTSAPDSRLLWPFAMLAASIGYVIALTIGAQLWTLSLRRLGLSVSLLVCCLALVASWPRASLLRRSQLVLPVPSQFNRQTPRTTEEFPFALTTAPPGDDRCGVASPPCIVHMDAAKLLDFEVDESGRLARVRR